MNMTNTETPVCYNKLMQNLCAAILRWRFYKLSDRGEHFYPEMSKMLISCMPEISIKYDLAEIILTFLFFITMAQ